MVVEVILVVLGEVLVVVEVVLVLSTSRKSDNYKKDSVQGPYKNLRGSLQGPYNVLIRSL